MNRIFLGRLLAAIAAVLICNASVRTVLADEASTLSLAQAVERALAGNVGLRKERATLARALAHETLAQGQFDVHIGSNLATSRGYCSPLDPSCTAVANSTLTSSSFDLSLSRAIETGGSLKLTGSATRTDFLSGPGDSSSRGSLVDSSVVLAFTHPLLRGFGPEVTLANLRKARIQRDMAALGRQMRACNVLRDVVSAYWELAYATQDLAIKRSAVLLAQDQLRITQARIDAGRLAPSDSASVERAIAQRLEDLATMEQVLLFRSLDLQRLFGVPVQAKFTLLAAADAPPTNHSEIEISTAIEQALAGNPQLRALRLGLSLSQTDLATARNTLLPKLDFTGSIGPAGQNTTLGDALGHVANLGNLTWSAGLSFDFPLQNRYARGQMREAQENLNLDHIEAEDFAMQIRDLVVRTATTVHTSAKRADLGRQEVAYATQNLAAERTRFDAGRATNNDVLLRQQELKDAETRLLRATVDENQSEATLAALTASILDDFGVVLKEF